jgi:GDP-D-mannose dehydratase
MKKQTILITGAAGQDGIILSKILIKNQYQVYGFIKKK